MSRFWISWWEPEDEKGDWRPYVVPDRNVVLGYWCSGHRYGDDDTEEASICALVEASSKDTAREALTAAWRLGERDVQWRFFDQVEVDWVPGDRFPMLAKTGA